MKTSLLKLAAFQPLQSLFTQHTDKGNLLILVFSKNEKKLFQHQETWCAERCPELIFLNRKKMLCKPIVVIERVKSKLDHNCLLFSTLPIAKPAVCFNGMVSSIFDSVQFFFVLKCVALVFKRRSQFTFENFFLGSLPHYSLQVSN